jgi:hypothetical protein
MVENDGQRLGLLPLPVAFVVLGKQSGLSRNRRAVIARRDQPLQRQLVKICREVLEKVALERVVAVAVDNLPTKGVRVELQVRLDLLLDVDVLRVELVLLRLFGVRQALVGSTRYAAQKSTPGGQLELNSRCDITSTLRACHKYIRHGSIVKSRQVGLSESTPAPTHPRISYRRPTLSRSCMCRAVPAPPQNLSSPPPCAKPTTPPPTLPIPSQNEWRTDWPYFLK